MDDDVLALVREERLVAAATLANARGDAKTASELYERACEFRRASESALTSGDVARALRLAVDANDEALSWKAIEVMLTADASGTRVVFELDRKNAHALSARVHERLGAFREAAAALERSGDTLRAASMWERANDPARASTVLDSAMRSSPDDARLNVAQGFLLLRHGKNEAALRALQKVAATSPERRRALDGIVKAATAMGLAEAAVVARAELDDLGGPLPSSDADTQSAAGLQVRGLLFGRYEVVREVASSATARVTECKDRVRGERVAVKVFVGYGVRGGGRDALARFEREVRVLANLDHANLVPMRDYVDEGPAIVMPWMEGGTLEAKIRDERITPRRAVEIASAMLLALAEAHRFGVLHRDVKPANVLFDGAGVTKLADFGVAHLGEVDATATAAVIGTLAYMSPEQREGRPATIASDIFGVGAVLLEMLTGSRPGPLGSLRVMPSGIHKELDARHDEAVLTLLSDAPEARPKDAFEARRALLALPWPDRYQLAAPLPKDDRPPSVRPGRSRLVDGSDGLFDTWVERAVRTIPWDEAIAARARAFASARSPCLETLFRVDRVDRNGSDGNAGSDAKALWLDGRTLPASVKSLSASERRELEEAVAELHAAGFVHGAIDGESVRRGPDGALVLRFSTRAIDGATVETDRAAIAALP